MILALAGVLARRRGLTADQLCCLLPGLALVLATTYILRWIEAGTRSFLTSGVVCLVPVALSSLERDGTVILWLRRVVWGVGVVLAVALAAGQRASLTRTVRWAHESNFSSISHTAGRNASVERLVPPDATLLALLVHGNVDYGLFGRNYGRRVDQFPDVMDTQQVDQFIRDHPLAYVYVSPARRAEAALLEADPRVVRLSNPWEDSVFRVRPR